MVYLEIASLDWPLNCVTTAYSIHLKDLARSPS